MTDRRSGAQRADAARNRQRLLEAARAALVDGAELSMADVARRAGLGMATLYRNYASRRELLEELFSNEVEEVCRAAAHVGGTSATGDDGAIGGDSAADALKTWLRRFVRFLPRKHRLTGELLRQPQPEGELLRGGRERVLAAGRPLLSAAQREGVVRPDLSLEQILDLMMAVALIEGPPEYTDPLLATALDGLRLPAQSSESD